MAEEREDSEKPGVGFYVREAHERGLDKERKKAASEWNALDYYDLCNQSGVEPEFQDLYDQGRLEASVREINEAKGLKPSPRRLLTQEERGVAKMVSEQVIGDGRYLYHDTGRVKAILEAHGIHSIPIEKGMRRALSKASGEQVTNYVFDLLKEGGYRTNPDQD